MGNACKWKSFAAVLGIVCIALAGILLAYKYNHSGYKNDDDNSTGSEKKKNTEEEKVFKPPPYPHCLRDDFKGLQILVRQYVILQITCNTSAPLASLPQPGPGLPTGLCPHSVTSTTGTVTLSESETRTTILVYAAVVLLLASLGAAFIEVWRARGSLSEHTPPPGVPLTPSGTASGKSIPGTIREKPELSRRCSLADLTVLRHNRRESMMRRDSVMHMSIDNGTNGPIAAHHTRIPLKLLGTVTPPNRPRLRVD